MKQIIGLVSNKSDKNYGIKINNMWVNFTPEEYQRFVNEVDFKFPVRIVIDDEENRNVLKWESMKQFFQSDVEENKKESDISKMSKDKNIKESYKPPQQDIDVKPQSNLNVKSEITKETTQQDTIRQQSQSKQQSQSSNTYEERLKLEIEKQDDIKRQVLFKGAVDIILKMMECRLINYRDEIDIANSVIDVYEEFLERLGLNKDKKY